MHNYHVQLSTCNSNNYNVHVTHILKITLVLLVLFPVAIERNKLI